MSSAMAAPPASAPRAPSDPLAAPRAAARDGEGEALAGFAATLSGLVFDAALVLPVAGEGEAAETPADDTASADALAEEAVTLPALDTPLAMLPALPAMSVVVLPTVAAAVAGQDARTAAPAPAAAPLAGTAGSLQRFADAIARPAPQPAAAPEAARPTASAEGLQTRLKTEPGTAAESGATESPEAPAVVPATVAAAPAREAAAALQPAVKLAAAQPEQWRPSLMEALGERIRLAVTKHSEQAVIRLDPPMLGSVEIVLRHQGGALQVQLSASHDEVVRQLQHIGDSLRQELSRHQYTDVSVQVFAGSRDGDGRQRSDGQPEQRQPGRALAEADGDSDQPPAAFVLSSNGN
ncbi:MAG TPA: flagellar hook-length control protein FliK [Azonexus sp.]